MANKYYITNFCDQIKEIQVVPAPQELFYSLQTNYYSHSHSSVRIKLSLLSPRGCSS